MDIVSIKEIFSTSSVYRILNYRGIKDPTTSFIWQPLCPSNISIFNWLPLRKKLHTKDRLSRNGIQVEPTCPLCSSEAETRDHLFLHCSFTRNGWDRMLAFASLVPFSLSYRPWECRSQDSRRVKLLKFKAIMIWR
ncbi:hypothetical protein Cni_G23009 [Canna indica]|uniref:Reverse transcriptase zinc-binding domain-containing protein n=1 Tax=Canna indica TaxID=4628 RepID=A0AAQ3KSU4_9LILI|nr:hypothetical protein Cni_G23009 [Canna indica]